MLSNQPKRGEIWRVEFDPAQGDEIRKTRPAIVMNAASVGRLALCIVVPVTGWNNAYAEYSWLVPLEPTSENGLSKASTADAFQVKSLSRARFVEKIGTLSPERINAIAAAIAFCVGYEPDTPVLPSPTD